MATAASAPERTRIVSIVGLGALGSHTVALLRNEDAVLRVVDFDRVSAANVRSQMHTKSSVGKNKAVSLQGTMRMLYGAVLIAVPSRLTAENAAKVLEGSALVLDCCDNADARRAAQAGASAAGAPCLHAGLAAAGAYGLVAWDEAFRVDDAPTGAATCEDGAFLPFIARVAALVAESAALYLKTGERRGWAASPAHVERL